MFNDERDLVNIIASLKVFKTKLKYIEDNLFERHNSTNQGINAKIDALQNQTYKRSIPFVNLLYYNC